MNVRAALVMTLSGVFVTVLCGCTAAETAPTNAPTAPTNSSEPSSFSLEKLKDDAWSRVSSRFPNAVRPEVEFVRFVTLEEWPSVRADCLGTLGFDVQVSSGGGIEGSIPVEQEEAFAVARYQCDVKYSADPKYSIPLDDGQLDLLYAYFVGELTTCLESEGFITAAPPSQTVFKETYYSSASWSPYNEVVTALGDRSLNEVNAACPQLPSKLYDSTVG